MPKLTIRARQVEPGSLVFFSLDRLTRPARKGKINFAECGVCEHEHCYWIGEQAQAEGKDVLRVSTLEALEKRNEEYPSWGEEEILLFIGRDQSGKLVWFLRSTEEYENKEGWATHH